MESIFPVLTDPYGPGSNIINVNTPRGTEKNKKDATSTAGHQLKKSMTHEKLISVASVGLIVCFG
jgi:hypothetical protein